MHRRELDVTLAMSALLALAIGGVGCYRYVPADGTQLTAGHDVRVRINEAESNRFATVLPDDTRLVEGRVIRDSADTLLLEVPVSSNVLGSRIETLNQRLDFSRAGIVDIELRELDRTKTTIVIAGAGGIGLFLLGKGLSGAFRGGDDNGNMPGEEIVVPVFLRIRF